MAVAGHSKWSNIKRRKFAQDAKRGQIFMRHSRNIYVAARENGGDPETNPALRLAIEQARDVNMPNANIERAIQKATGTLDGVRFEEVTYEGYGPGGVAVIVQALTDNRHRTAAEVRHAFSKNEGNLGETGSVSYMFDRKGHIVILNEDGSIDEDDMTIKAIEAGADDITFEEGAFEILTDPKDFAKVRDALLVDYELEESEITLIAHSYNTVDLESEEKMLSLIEMLEEDEDIQDVHHNMEITE